MTYLNELDPLFEVPQDLYKHNKLGRVIVAPTSSNQDVVLMYLNKIKKLSRIDMLQNAMRLKSYLPKRNPWSHKGQFGSILIVGGSEKYSGSPIFNGLAALRSGSDLATLTGPKRAMDGASSISPDLITIPLDGELGMKHVPFILREAKNHDVLVIGGGLSREKRTYAAILDILRKIDLPVVVDAEALRALSEKPEIIQGVHAILTPHADEFRALTGEKLTEDLDARKKTVKKWAKKLDVTILLKGHIDVISDGKSTSVNESGTVYMTKGGFGDILAGICGSFLAAGLSPYRAAKAAAHINGKAGEAAAKRYGPGVLASDALPFIPIAG